MKKLKYFIVMGVLFLPTVTHAVTLSNPLGINDPRLIIARIIQAILSISGSIALLMFVYGGFLWLSSGGNSAQIDKGKKVLVWATLGVVLIASAFVIVTALFQGLASGNVNAPAPTPTTAVSSPAA